MAHKAFRFQTLLRIRESERQQRRSELAQAYEAERLLREQLDALAVELVQTGHDARAAAAPGELNVDRMLDLRRHALRLQAQVRGLEQRRAQVQGEIERRRLVLVEADRQVRTLEKLLERQLVQQRTEEQQIEQRVLDEVGARVVEGLRRRDRG